VEQLLANLSLDNTSYHSIKLTVAYKIMEERKYAIVAYSKHIIFLLKKDLVDIVNSVQIK
jgi:hypothetical protein